MSFLPSIIILGTLALVAVVLTVRRSSPRHLEAQRKRAAIILGLAILVQVLHFYEEASTGINVEFPALFGLPPVELQEFININVIALVIWAVSVPGVRFNIPGAFFAAWFLALAGMLNLVGHPLMAIAAGGYFPGLYTSPVTGAAAIWLWRRLQAATEVVSVPQD